MKNVKESLSENKESNALMIKPGQEQQPEFP